MSEKQPLESPLQKRFQLNKSQKLGLFAASALIAIVAPLLLAFYWKNESSAMVAGLLLIFPVMATGYFTGFYPALSLAIIASTTLTLSPMVTGAIWDQPAGVPYDNLLIKFIYNMVYLLISGGLTHLLHKQNRVLTTMEWYDSFTGTLNRRGFLTEAQAVLDRARRYTHPAAIAYLDISNLRTVNNEIGCGMGDMIIQSSARILKNNLRTTDLLARVSADEFAILFSETGEAARSVLAKIMKKLVDVTEKDGWPIHYNAGLLIYTKPPGRCEEMVKRVHALMLRAKASGKNQIKEESASVNQEEGDPFVNAENAFHVDDGE